MSFKNKHPAKGEFHSNMKTVVEGKKEFETFVKQLILKHSILQENPTKVDIMKFIAIRRYNYEKNNFGTKNIVTDKLKRLFMELICKEFPEVKKNNE